MVRGKCQLRNRGVREMFNVNHESCPYLYECSKISMTPMIRALLRCSADEARKSICANCDEWQVFQTVGESEKLSVGGRS